MKAFLGAACGAVILLALAGATAGPTQRARVYCGLILIAASVGLGCLIDEDI